MENNELINTKLSSKRALAIGNIKMTKMKIKFDIQTLNMIIAFLCKDSVLRTRKTVQNIQKIFDNTDMSIYEDNPELSVRVWVIENITNALLTDRFESTDWITVYLKEQTDDPYTLEFIDTISTYQIKYAESKFLIKKIDSVLEYGYVATVRSVMQQILDQIDITDYASYGAVSDDLYNIALTVIDIKRKCKSLDADQTFSLEQELFDQVVTDSVTKLKDRNRIFITGCRYLNVILSPGYMSKRLYMYLAFPGKGKSMILLKAALDIKKYNTRVKTKNPDKRPAVLFLTLENDIAETIERMYNMSVDTDDIRNYTPKQVIDAMRTKGGLRLNDDNPIDIIIKEYKNRELNTEDLYSIINDLSDQGVETIALIVDYVKRIRPTEYAASEKEELKNITNELKELAKYYDIPVITAQQLNRNGAAVVDAAIQANKEDVTRLVGRDAVAGAWEIIENSDFVCIINPQVQRSTKKMYMAFNLLKRRYKSSETDEDMRRLQYFNQPFEENSEIRLVDDIDMDESVALTSLGTQFDPVDEKRTKQTAKEVKTGKSLGAAKASSIFSDFDANAYNTTS